MERFMLHLKNNGFFPEDAGKLLNQARTLCSDQNATIRDTRVSSKFLEFDISIDKSKLEKLIRELQSLGNLDHAKHVVEESIPKEEAIQEGIDYFNNERFWECHEVLEGVWKNCYEGEKDLVQGIILVAAALVHFQKAQNEICLSILERALSKLANCSGNYYKIDVDDLRNKINQIKNSGRIITFVI